MKNNCVNESTCSILIDSDVRNSFLLDHTYNDIRIHISSLILSLSLSSFYVHYCWKKLHDMYKYFISRKAFQA